MKVGLQQHLQQLVPVDVPDQAAGVVVGGDIGGILREDVAHSLVDGVIALLAQGVVNGGQCLADLLLPVLGDGEGNGWFMRSHWLTPIPA